MRFPQFSLSIQARILLPTLLLFFALPGHTIDCQHAINQTDLNQCANQDYQRASYQLNQTYQHLRLKMGKNKEKVKLLTQAQRGWLQLRTSECLLQSYASQGSSAYPMVIAECLKKKTKMREKTLRQMTSCNEGDLSCMY